MKIQRSVKNISKLLMISTIVMIVAFQCYWITGLYKDEWQNLSKETDVIFRDVVYKLQLQRFRSDTTFFVKGIPDNLFVFDVMDSVKEKFIDSAMKANPDAKERKIMISVTSDKHFRDSMDDRIETVTRRTDSLNIPPFPRPGPPGLMYFSGIKNINDSLPVAKIDSAYNAELSKNNIDIAFTVKTFLAKDSPINKTPDAGELKTNIAFTGLSQAHAYQAAFANPRVYIFDKLKFPLLISVMLILITVLSFIFLYRNLIQQRRLAEIKNEFISNITHELKTPIATVNVAIEALRNFNALQSPERTKEYLDISASELQRLSLLVDKVLRLSMFENKDVELKKEQFDLWQLAEEITSTMKLQFDKAHASVTLSKKGNNFIVEADRLHITSVVYNLLDNALKYSNENPEITVEVISHDTFIELCVKDKGIGIAKAYRQKIFEKFFRIPGDDRHNIKGYGLGLSYVSHIARLHMGFIEVESTPGEGSIFSLKLPYKEASVIDYGKGRIIRKMSL